MKITGKTALFALAVLAACSDSTAAPMQKSIVPESANGTKAPVTQDTLTFAITINPKKLTVYNLGGGNQLVLPAGSLCDPSSLYGPAYWDQPCTPATKNVTLSVAVWLNSAGNPQVDFTPSVRFVPSADTAQWVMLTFADTAAAASPMYNIDYCPSSTATCYDESQLDSTLATYRDPISGQLTRRIKHFSGYNVAAGYSGDGGDGSSLMSLTPGASLPTFRIASVTGRGTRSGFMLASGDQAR